MYTMKDIHDASNKMLAEVDRICKKNNISYFMDGGTLLGAVRHKGNIPWDDDIDIIMPRQEYEKFLKIVEGELSEGFEFFLPKDYGERSFYDFIPHIAYKNSSVKPIEGEMEFYNNKLNHLVLDIFIADDIPDNAMKRKIKIIKLKLLYALSWGHRYKINYNEYSFAQKIVAFVMSRIGKLFKQTTITKWYDKISQSDNNKGYKSYFGSNYILKEIHYVYDKEWYSDFVELDFAEYKFRAPIGYDGVLKTLFKDYMKLPPKEMQVPEHYDLTSEYLKIN